MSRHIIALFIIMALASFLGFWVENIWLSFTKGYMDNRNMHLPFLLGYGLTVFAIYFLFGTPEAPKFLGFDLVLENKKFTEVVYFIIVFVCISVGEWMLGTIVEKKCGIIWWDYTKLPLHITKYTSIPTSIAFTFMVIIFMNVFFVPVYNSLMMYKSSVLLIIACILMLAMVIDFMYSAVWMMKKRELLNLWKINTRENIKRILSFPNI